ncbi:Zinc finger CCCH-type protein [Neofusicoccum parvum]|uniref:Zinc finger CCCH-type protein n=1 Tax=Neofusicoccum parvum TaxID=310453 RepID=A0ACB5SFS5_9PEZI|nr:Zinc finger CCCH-type protein [Neofusicoccum parvum]
MRNSLDMTPPGSPSLYKAFLRPNWFIQRENGAYVPVIPVDELPPDIDLEGAPRSLKMEDAQGMKFLEKLPFNGQTYSLAHRARRESYAVDSWARRHAEHHYTDSQKSLRPLQLSSSARPSGSQGISDHDREPRKPNEQERMQKEDPKTTAAALPKFEFNPAVRTRPLPPSGREPDQTKKEYCTYWIKTGECDFMQQGCLFKHEMPDLKTLREKVGIHSVPHWYQVKFAMTRRNTDSRTLTKPPSWLQHRIIAADQRAAHSDDSGSESEEEVAKSMRENRKMLLPAPPAPSTPSTTKATAGPAISFGFRAPDHNVRHTAKRSLESHAVLSLMKPNAQLKTKEEQEGTSAACATEITAPDDNDQQNLIDFSTSPPIDRDASTLTSLADLTAPAPGSKAANKKKAPSSTRRATFLPARDTLPPTRRRSISDTQADIFNLIRATSHDSGRHSRASHRSTQSTCAKPSIRSTMAIKHKPTTTTKANMKSYFPSTGPISSSAPPATAIPSPAAKKPPSATTTSPAAATPSTLGSGYTSSSDTSNDGGNASSPAFSRTSSATTTSTTASAIPKLATPRPSRPASASSGLAVASAPALPAKPKHRRAASAVTKKSWPPLGGLQASRHAAGRAEEEGEGEDVPSFEPHTVVTARGECAGSGGGKGRGKGMATMTTTTATTTGRGRRAGGTRVPVKVGGKVAMGAGGEA